MALNTIGGTMKKWLQKNEGHKKLNLIGMTYKVSSNSYTLQI